MKFFVSILRKNTYNVFFMIIITGAIIMTIAFFYMNQNKEAVAQRCSVKKVLLEISQNSQEKTCARVSFLIKLQA